MVNPEIKIALVDDEELVVKLLDQFLTATGGFKVVLTAFDGSEFLEKLKNGNVIPDIALIDMRMKIMNGIETVTELKKNFPDIKVITLSSHYENSFMGYMLKLGVNAFIPKGISPQLLLEVVQSVYDKGFYLSEDQIEIMRNQISASAPQPKFTKEETLSKRELEVLELICHQYSTAEIAEKLFITKRTVEGHRNNLFLKTGVKNIAGLVVFAVQKHLIDLNEYNLETTEKYKLEK
ncbi:MAG: response regulator transcription factor [Salinivirgaceae bacterium]|nr:response regulator transcription factor [Salinivirgaceae bacterium]